MKISALRVADVGRFRKPVALEGLTDGLNVLAGENELGKSTLFRALLAVFQTSYTSREKSVASLQPYDGGAPLIEADFAVGARLWRIRKRFLQRGMAELVDLETGASVAKNADVQAKLNELRAGPSGLERFGLLWIGQGESLVDFRLAPDAATNLRQFVQQEIEGAAADEQAHLVHQKVLARLATLITPKQGKPTGEFAKAIAECEAAERRSEDATTRLAAAEARLSALSHALAEAEQLRSPVTRAARQKAIAEAEQAIHKATQDAALARAATDAWKAAEAAAAAAKLAHDAWHRELARFAATRDELERLNHQLGILRAGNAKTIAEVSRLKAVTEDLSAHLAALDAERAAARAAADWSALVARRDDLANRLKAVRSFTAELSQAEASLHSNPVDEPTLKSINELATARDRLDQRLTAAAPEVSIEPLPGMHNRFVLNGKALDSAAPVRVRKPLQIDIEGIGRIDVRPGGDATLAADESERARIDLELRTRLASLALPDMAAVEQAAEARRKDERRRDELRARLAGMAPDGVELLLAAHGELVAMTAASPPPTNRDLAEIEREASDVSARLNQSSPDLASLVGQLEAARREELRIETLATERRARLEELGATLGSDAARTSRTEDLEKARAAADAALAAAARDANAWRALRTSPDDITALERRLTEARAAEAVAQKRIHDLELDIRGWETALQADNDTDIEHEAQIAAQSLARARSRLDGLKQEVAALRQLDTMLTAAFEAERTEVIEPVARSIAPYLQKVLPGASLHIDDKLAPASIVRDGRPETLDRISRGTAEQVAVVTRLGLARLLADRKAPAPLILDDALVYADDKRIASLFEALTDAASRHQVIVLTCREKTFADLAGNRVNLTEWRMSN